MQNKKWGWLELLTVLAAIMVAVNFYVGLIYAPDPSNLQTEVTRKAQHIFYYHMGMNVMAGLGMLVNFIGSVLYLLTRRRFWDAVARSAAEIGVLFGIGVLVSGSLWARPTWNTWWTWDPRLTTATITILLYAAYLMLRNAVEDPDRQARFAAVYGTFAFISVPITFMSIRLWRTIHPTVFGGGDPAAKGAFALGPHIRFAMQFSSWTFMLVFLLFLVVRVRVALLEERVMALRQQVDAQLSRGAEVDPMEHAGS
ncbi:MAG: cytochrome c biogenesis protein CcsA [Chloroflexi bacterium]|nr:cytochrome c biogenesis protein CcsA [Chloroflexota bacterium]